MALLRDQSQLSKLAFSILALRRCASSLLMTLVPLWAYAEGNNLFSIQIDVSGLGNFNRVVGSISAIPEYFKESEISKSLPGYNGTQPVTVSVSYPGISLKYQYPTAGSAELVLKIPELGVSKTFSGASRTESRQMARDFLKASGYQTKLAEILVSNATAVTVATTSTDPVAGNPYSLLSNLVRNDFNQQFLAHLSPQYRREGELGLNYRYGVIEDKSRQLNARTVTPYYRMAPNGNGAEMILSAPLTFLNVEGGNSYQAGLASAYRIPVNSYWTLSGGVTYALTGSSAMERLAQYGGVSIASDLHWDVDGGWRWSIGNMLGKYRTFKLAGVDPGLSNAVLTNALAVSRPFVMFGEPLRMELFVTQTRYSGSLLHQQQSWEVGATVLRRTASRSWQLSTGLISSMHQNNAFVSISASF